ncbi:hypothetical protein [Candidatus Viridilinea mediisalina]|nr:hypothetical protein [Candidatus Viridilinea mediisalina]
MFTWRGGFDKLASTSWLRQAGFGKLSHRATELPRRLAIPNIT